MNKKFSTLVAGLVLAGSLPVSAQFCPPTKGEVPYRTRFVKAATLDKTFQDVKKINQNYWYQLQVDPASLGITVQDGQDAGEFVLVVERDYSTGKLYLTAKPVTEAVLTHSLWQIKQEGYEVAGRRFCYVNKETGFELTFDHANALTAKADGTIDAGTFANDKPNKGWNYENEGLLDGCNKWWSWYTTEQQSTSALDYKKIYSYFHNSDSVMYLQAVKKADAWAVTGDVYASTPAPATNFTIGRDLTSALSANGLDGEEEFAIVAVKNSRANAETYLSKANLSLKIKPVVAGAKVLNAEEINSMIDADGSWLTFVDAQGAATPIWEYDAWNEASDTPDNGKKTKFTVCKPGTKIPMTFATNPFDFEYKAIPSADEALKREATNAEYAGYDILFETVKPILEAGLQKQYGYLYVSEYPYEGQAFQGIYNGLEVKNAPYAYLTEKDGAKVKNVVLKYANVPEAEAKAVVTANDADALQARYHWKVTYYATNDSVVFEPLNASRMSQPDATAKLAFEKSNLANATAEQFLNTVNEGKAYATGWSGAAYNTMFNKAPKVPVALYAMNFGPAAGDAANFLTVGYASGKTLKDQTPVDATSNEFAAKIKGETGNPAYVTNGTEGKEYQSAMELVVRFANNYTWLKRATMASGVYFINLSTGKYSTAQTESRVNGAYIVEDMKGHVVYDVAQNEQDFNHMPATQWVVEQTHCDATSGVNKNEVPVVSIHNREFANEAFEGQLYKTAEDKIYIINHRAYHRDATRQTVDRHARNVLNCADTITFQPVTVTEFGYFNESEDVLRNTVYGLQNIFDMAGFKFLGIDDLDASIDTLKLLPEGAGTQFELYRSEGWYPVKETYEVIENGVKKVREAETFKFAYADSAKYGYQSDKAGATQLYKTFFKLKLKDTNLIDNDHRFVAINNQHKYVVALESEINDPKNQLTFAIVTLKENNEVEGEHCYALVNAEQYKTVKSGATIGDLTGLREATLTDNLGVDYTIFYKDIDENGTYNSDKDVIYVTTENSIKQVSGKLVVEGTTLDAKVADLCETTSSVFALVQSNRPLYRTFADELVNNMNKVADIRTIDEQGRESLFEDTYSNEAKHWTLNYLGAENLGNQTNREGLYIDKVAKSSPRMQQYLFAVAVDSVPAYRYCNETLPDGQPKHGVNPTCGHDEEYAGYVEGRFLVNFNDSIQSHLINKYSNADRFKSSNYVRLGFVEAVHRGDTLFILKAPYTLESIKIASEDANDTRKYVRPDYLFADKAGIVYDAIELNGEHNNVAFSLRNVGDSDEFMIESNDLPNNAVTGKPQSRYSQIGSFAGAWIQIHNNVPVLAKFATENGDHNTDDSTDAWKEYGDWTTIKTEGQLINQAARFVIEGIDKDASTTANDEIAASEVAVVGVKGAVIVKGAAGKKVAICNVLGQSIANVVLSSDNETISVPAGIVAVSVDGEEAAKVIVK